MSKDRPTHIVHTPTGKEDGVRSASGRTSVVARHEHPICELGCNVLTTDNSTNLLLVASTSYSGVYILLYQVQIMRKAKTVDDRNPRHHPCALERLLRSVRDVRLAHARGIADISRLRAIPAITAAKVQMLKPLNVRTRLHYRFAADTVRTHMSRLRNASQVRAFDRQRSVGFSIYNREKSVVLVASSAMY